MGNIVSVSGRSPPTCAKSCLSLTLPYHKQLLQQWSMRASLSSHSLLNHIPLEMFQEPSLQLHSGMVIALASHHELLQFCHEVCGNKDSMPVCCIMDGTPIRCYALQ